MTAEPLFDDEVPDNYDELPDTPTVAELIPHVDSWRRNAYSYTGGNLDAVMAACGRYLRILALVDPSELALAEALAFTRLPDGWTLTRHIDDSYGYGDCPDDDKLALTDPDGTTLYLLNPPGQDGRVYVRSVQNYSGSHWWHESIDAAVAELTVPLADRIAAIPEGGAQQVELRWYLRPPGTPRAVQITVANWGVPYIDQDDRGAPTLCRADGKPGVFRYEADGVVWNGMLRYGIWTEVPMSNVEDRPT